MNAAQIDLIVEGKVDKNGREDVHKKLIAMNSSPSQDVNKTKIKCLAPGCTAPNFSAMNMPR